MVLGEADVCGFVGGFDLGSGGEPLEDGMKEALRTSVLEMVRKIRHRGPDWSGVWTGSGEHCGTAVLAHERLAIVDPMSGKQPLVSADGNVVLAVNGEIYNHKEIRSRYAGKYDFKTQSDCEVILPLYQEKGTSLFGDLVGDYAFALYDKVRDVYLVGRDPIGIVPLYQGWDKDGRYYVASEMKALEGVCSAIEEFPNGSYLMKGDKTPTKWYHREWESFDAMFCRPDMGYNDERRAARSSLDVMPPVGAAPLAVPPAPLLSPPHEVTPQDVRQALEAAVRRQMMCDVPYGVLLSGGLDSSIIAAVAQKFASRRVEENGREEAWWPRLHSFAIGLAGSPDLLAARKAAEYIGTVHHEVHFTVQEALDALLDVIYHIETYDITTVRASTPMYLLARVIKSMGIKMVLSGEGSDELFGGYLYFHKAPNEREFHEELVRKISKLHLYDCLRANKSLMAWGVEGRVPFLDRDFIDVAMSVSPRDKMCIRQTDGTQRIEKWILREAFKDYLPPEIAWRQKEQFSDGVGYNWIDTLKQVADEKISDAQFAVREKRFPVNTPVTKEEYWYREMFEKLFPSETAARTVPHEASIACSTAKALEWDAAWKDMDEPSGRAMKGVHVKAY